MDLHDLETKGYLIIKDFLTSDEVDLLKNDYITQPLIDNNNYPLKLSSNAATHEIRKKIKLLLDNINSTTSLTVDRILGNSIYTDTSLKKYPWHQDHESFYIFQQHKNYLNFFITFIKPDKSESGLNLIPFDKLKEKSQLYFDKICSSGATIFTVKENITQVSNNETGEKYTLPFKLDELKISPELGETDLLIIRGDIVHQTQEGLSTRVAISIRCTNSLETISREKLNQGCKIKFKYLENNPVPYKKINSLFEKYARNEITAWEYLDDSFDQSSR
jgi:hypothetical protein